MNQANRLIVNTVVTFARMALTVGIGLATTRLLLATLGEVDFGVYTALGGGLTLIMLVSAALAESAQRHLAFEIGRNDPAALREIFSTSVVIYAVLALLVAAAGVALRPLFLHGLTIPPSRLHAAGWVYDLSVFDIAASVLVTPFFAVFLARQAMVQDAVFATVTSVTALLAVLLASRVHADELVGYAVLITGFHVALMALQVIRGLLLFPESRFRYRYFRAGRVRELVGFAGWSFLTSIAWQLRTQGGTILLNVFFGPVVNASYAIAAQLNGYMANFSGVIARATRPAITSLHGAGQHQASRDLSLSTSKLTVLLSSLIAVPTIIHARALLQLWLGHVPPYADAFAPLMMLWLLTIQLTLGHGLALAATGDIGPVVRISFWINIAPLPVAAALFYLGLANPIVLPLAAVAATIAHASVNVFFTGTLIGVRPGTWFRRVLAPCVLVIALGVGAALAAAALLAQSPYRVAASSLVYLAVLPVPIWFGALEPSERRRLLAFAHAAGARLHRRPLAARPGG